MYSEEAIDTLISRIGWSELSSGLPFNLSEENKTSESGKTFNLYHAMVLVDNIYATVPEIDMEEEDFNAYLADVRKQSVLNVLTAILDTHQKYDPAKDYSNIITTRTALFEDAIGFSVASKIIELFLTTTRQNFIERSAASSYQILKIELEGARDEKGNLVTKGLAQKLSTSISNARKVIFPIVPTVTSKKIM